MSVAERVQRLSPRAWFFFKSLRYRYYNGEHEIWLVRHLLTKGKLAIDVGASIGLYSRELARHWTTVIAFEANPRVADFARLVMPRNVEVKNVALSSQGGEASLRVPLNRRKNAVDDLATIEPNNKLQPGDTLTETVPAKRLDDYRYLDCDFIKIDVEGHEEAVLEGATRLIEAQRPALLIELEDAFNVGTVERVTKRLGALRYSGYQLVRGRLRPLQDLGPRDPRAFKNFIFIPEGAPLPTLSRWDRVANSLRTKFGR